MGEAQSQGCVCANPDGDEPIGTTRGPGAPDVDYDQFCALTPGHVDEGNLMYIGAIEIRPPRDDHVGILDPLWIGPSHWPNRQLPGFPTTRVAHRSSINTRCP